MNIDELKKLVKNSTAVLVLDNGEPSFVILKYDTYKDLVLAEPVKEVKISHVGNNHAINPANGLSKDDVKPTVNEVESEVLERINKDILALKEEIEKEEKATIVE
ncbi:MAG: hypothetical protein HYT67_02435 [Candidatus Yanofskybacteria bacterium]|nr:hypothetical protein [Candidatus Yanofskybacteria bacterium]MBI2594889.1 hypothetical protein [Candidatus Colwellbacteria bacterium]